MASGFQFALLVCLASGLLAVEACCEEKKPCCPVCPPGWTRFGSRCFFFYLRGRSWDQAERYCLSVGGNLASIHSDEEHSFLREYMFRVSGGYRVTWIGGHDAVKEGVWLWSDGSNFNYQRWAANLPNNLGRGEHCLEMNYAGPYWNDRPCPTVRSFLCSKDLPCCDNHHFKH